MRSFLSKNWHICLLLLITCALFWINYVPGTWLTGWDNLHTEFAFKQNLLRSISGVWQHNEGLGHLAGNALAADILRQVFLWVLSLAFPISMLRYIFLFLMLFIGGWGASSFLRKHANKSLGLCFLGGLYYMLNLATLQTFYIHLEAFIVHFALLPWIVSAVFEYWKSGSKKNLLALAVINILFLPQSFIPTMFVVYCIVLSVLSVAQLITAANKAAYMKRIGITAIVILLINLFWLLPFAYFVITSANVTTEAKINKYGTWRVVAQNEKYGTISNVILLKGFALDNLTFSPDEDVTYIMPQWKDFISSKPFNYIGYTFFLLICMGLFAMFKNKWKYKYHFAFLFIFTFIILANGSAPFLYIVNFLQGAVPLFKQVFRASFTKFSILLCFVYAVLLVQGLEFFMYKVVDKFKITSTPLAKYIFYGCIFATIVYMGYPSFKSNFIYPKARVKIPSEYFKLFEYFENVGENERIANFPQPWFWGWSLFNWGYDGSGFLWYGLKQPVMDRAFDVWSNEGENYYWQISQAIYSENIQEFENTLKKYNVSYILLDKQSRSYSNYRALYIERLIEKLNKSQSLKKISGFGSQLLLYKFLPSNSKHLYTTSISESSNKIKWNNADQVFNNGSDYISYDQTNSQKLSRIYPFTELFSAREDIPKIDVTSDTQTVTLRSDEYDHISRSRLYFDQLTNAELHDTLISSNSAILKMVSKDKNDLDINLSNTSNSGIELDESNKVSFQVSIDKPINSQYFYSSKNNPEIFDGQYMNCDKLSTGYSNKKLSQFNSEKYVMLESQNEDLCYTLNLIYLPQNIGYIVHVKSKNISGNSIRLVVNDVQARRVVIEKFLPKSGEQVLSDSYTFIPPLNAFGIGYQIGISNIALGNQITKNEIYEVEIIPMPFSMLQSINIRSMDDLMTSNLSNYVVLSESFNDGWLAYDLSEASFMQRTLPLLFANNLRLKDHVLINNWSNGWSLASTNRGNVSFKLSDIEVIYLPQYFQYFGYIILISTIFLLSCIVLREKYSR